jgi:hypothetical protein
VGCECELILFFFFFFFFFIIQITHCGNYATLVAQGVDFESMITKKALDSEQHKETVEEISESQEEGIDHGTLKVNRFIII